MQASVIWWELCKSKQTIDSLREYLRAEGVQPWTAVPGLYLKFWIADRENNRWGAVTVWESAARAERPMPPQRATELIGYPPAQRWHFDVEATADGGHSWVAPDDSWLAPDDVGSIPDANNSPMSDKTVEFDLPEFDEPPADPIELFRRWFQQASAQGVREPGALALGTADRDGRSSSRMVQVIDITSDGLVFTSHSESQKGRDIAATKWASGVLYWRETKQQLVLAGPVEQLSAIESDALWKARPVSTHPMSVASRQSEPLKSEEALRAEARRLAGLGVTLSRPAAWVGYHLRPVMVEFWQGRADRLHRRLRYDREGACWIARRLQP